MGAASRLPAVVRHETFELADGDRLALDAEHAAALALRFLRTHAPAHGGKRRVLRDDRGRAGDVAGGELRDETRDLQAHRAGGHAARVAAVQAAGRFQERLFLIVAVAYFFKIGRADLRVLLAHRYTGNSVCHITCPSLFYKRVSHSLPPPRSCTGPGGASPRRNRPAHRRTPARLRRRTWSFRLR